MSWLLHVSGVDNLSGRWYGFWSGFGGSWLPGYAGLVILYVWHHNCHVHRCWRIGRHPVEGTGYVVCRVHHPEGPVAAGQVADLHRRAARDVHVHVSTAADPKESAQQVIQSLQEYKRHGGTI